ncbi:MAG: heavy metal translocating P-type ATPase, partial [Lachnospiraceae bacterium]|nr:heavy metal translocating P-type ATPase [Lachnospiraceae bacterium]
MKLDDEKKSKLIRIIATIVIFIVIFLIPEKDFSSRDYLFFIPYFIIGYDVIFEAIENIKEREPFDEHFLMVVATVGALCLKEMHEAVMVMLLYQIGEFFQDMAVDKSKEDIGELMDIRPDHANLLLINGDTKTVKPEEVPVGNVILIKPGEKVPLDGIIIEGETSFNTTALNGESLPRIVSVGDNVISGFVNFDGVIKVKVTTNYAESTVSKIIALLDSATEKKSESENFINKFAKVYTPIVCALA